MITDNAVKMMHDPLGPSSIQGRRKDCPGSYQAELAISAEPEREEDPQSASNLGRERHRVAAEGLRIPESRDKLLEGLPDDDQPAVRAWWAFWEAEYSALRAIYAAEDIKFLIEHETTTTDGRICTLDAALIIPGSFCLVGDLKNANPGWVRYNLQVADYAGAVRRDFSTTDTAVAIVHRYGVDKWTYQPGELDARLRQISRIITECKKDDAERRPGVWCKYCRANVVCPKRCELTAQVTALADPVEVMKALDENSRRDLYDKMKAAIKKLEAVKEQIDQLVIDGQIDINGYAVGPGKAGRFWSDERAALIGLTQIAAQKGIDADKLTTLISVSQAEKLLGTKKEIAPLVASKVGKPSVKARSSDD